MTGDLTAPAYDYAGTVIDVHDGDTYKIDIDPPGYTYRARCHRAPGNTPYEDREWLRSRYEDSGLTMRQIAKEAGCSLRTIARWRNLHDISARYDRRRPVATGPDNPRWTGHCVCPECGSKKTHKSKRCRSCASRARTVMGDMMQMVRAWAADNWRPLVMERDGYTCCVCGDGRGGNLHAHHITHLSTLVRDRLERWSPDMSTAERRWDFVRRFTADPEVCSLANGQTLCSECHWDAHVSEGWNYHRPPLRVEA